MRVALQVACDVIIRDGIRTIVSTDRDDSIDPLIVELQNLVESARGGDVTLQLKINMHERLLQELESVREAHDSEPDFERRLVRNNITAVLGLTLPQHMKAIQAQWREIARHVAPHALRFAEQEYALPQDLRTLLGQESLEELEQVVSGGDTNSLVDALSEVEDLLQGNLRLRLTPSLDWLSPEGRVNIRQGVIDPEWLKAKAELARGKSSALDLFRNIDYKRQGRNLQARTWLAYALAKLGRASEIHEIIDICQGVVTSDMFNPLYNSDARWNLAVALNRVPARAFEALDVLLPILDSERHPADSLDLALLWATDQQRADVQERLFSKCRHHEAHLLAALLSARRGQTAAEVTVAPEHLRRLAAILANPDQEFPNPAEEIRDTRRLDRLVAEFARLQLIDAGIEWFRQRVTYPRERYSYKNWECLGELYERNSDLESSWYARRRSVQSTLRFSTKQGKPEIASTSLKRLLNWALRNGFHEDALRELRKSWRDTTLSQGEVAVWEQKLAPGATDIALNPNPTSDIYSGQNVRVETSPPGAARDSTRSLSGEAAREIVDRAAPLFDTVSTARALVAASTDASNLLAAAAALGRPCSPTVEHAIRRILALSTEFDQGTDEGRARSIDVEMRENGQLLQDELDKLPIEARGLARASLRVVQGLAAQLRGVPDLALTMPTDLRMRLDAPVEGRPLDTRLAVRLHNPAIEPASSVRIAISSETDELTIVSPIVTVDEIGPQQRMVVDFEVRLSGMPTIAKCGVRCHVSYQSVGVGRAINAATEVPVEPVGAPIPVTERLVTQAPVAADRVDLFQGRDRELTELKEAFSGGRLRRLYFVNGIRRVGKSSLMRHLGRVCSPEVLTLVVDFDLDKGLTDVRLIRELLRKAGRSLRSLPGFEEQDIPLPGAAEFELDAPWTVFENSLRELQRRTGRRILVCFDELQEVVARMADPGEPLGDSMLSWLRSGVQAESDLLFVCTGSESYDNTRRRVDSRLWGNMQPYNISFVDRPAMDRIVTVPVQPDGVIWLPESLDKLWDLTEGHPWVTQVLAAHALTMLNRERRKIVVPGDIDRAAETAVADASVSSLWWNEEEGVVTDVHRQVAFLILKNQARPRRGVTTNDLFQACARSGIQSPGAYVDVMASLELLTYEEAGPDGRWRIRGGFLERYLEGLLARVISESQVDTSARAANQPTGVFLDVENIKRSLLNVIENKPREERRRLEARLRGDELGTRLLRAASRHGRPTVKWAVANWHASYLEGDQMAYKSVGFQPDIAGEEKANASDHVLKEHIHDALRDNDLSAFVIGTGDGDFQAIAQTLQSQGKYLVLWATRDNMSSAFGANLTSGERMVVEFLEDIVFGDSDI